MLELLIWVSALLATAAIGMRLLRCRRDRTRRSARATDAGNVGLAEVHPAAVITTDDQAELAAGPSRARRGQLDGEAMPGQEQVGVGGFQPAILDAPPPTDADRDSKNDLLAEEHSSADIEAERIDDDGDQPVAENARCDSAWLSAEASGRAELAATTLENTDPAIGEQRARTSNVQEGNSGLPISPALAQLLAAHAEDGAAKAGVIRGTTAAAQPTDGDVADLLAFPTGEEYEIEVAELESEAADAEVAESAPRRYRPTPRLPRPSRIGAPKRIDPVARAKSLQMAVRLSFRAGDLCQFSLLAHRSSDLPDEVEVRGGDRTETLRALQEDWYELKAPGDLGGLLRDGAVWTSRQPNDVAKWTLSHRDVYVLGAVADFGGYVSTTSRLIVGEEHVVLCLSDRHEEVAGALAVAGCAAFRQIGHATGLPDGWIVFKNVKPTRSVPATNDGDILDTLRPLADIDIQLEGGIRIDRSEWLLGHAPRVRLRGDLTSAGTVLIDDQPVTISEDGTCESPNQGELGAHTVWSPNASRSYRVAEGQQDWEPWSAHPVAKGSICGGAVFALGASRTRARQIAIAAKDVCLIGATPGSVLHCSPDPASRSAVTIVFPPFDPVWIIPRFPLRSDRRARVTRMGDGFPQAAPARAKSRADRESLREWSRLILDAKRRKLMPDSSDGTSADLWNAYERVARSIWRRSK